MFTASKLNRFSLAAAFSALAFFLAMGCNASRPPIAATSSSAALAAVTPASGAEAQPLERTNPYDGNAIAIANGQRLYNWYNCAGCHGEHGGGGMGPSLRNPAWLNQTRDDQIFDAIAQGRPEGMPAWGGKVPQSQIWQLVAYIKSMNTPREADPPNEPANENVGPPSPQEPSGVPVNQ